MEDYADQEDLGAFESPYSVDLVEIQLPEGVTFNNGKTFWTEE